MKKIYFILGPCPASKKVLKTGGKKLKEFRNEEFSRLLKSLEKKLLKLLNAQKNSRVIFLASSGTGAMQGVMDNFLDKNTSALIVNGGGFGARFTQIANQKNLHINQYKIDKNEKFNFKSIIKTDALFINSCETSTGRLYKLKKLGNFCQKNDTLFIVDAISSFLCDEIDMKKQNIDALLISSNKGLALSPGLSMAGPDVIFIFTPSSFAIIDDNVVFPNPGGPYNRTWSRLVFLILDASINTFNFSTNLS